jgi:integrase
MPRTRTGSAIPFTDERGRARFKVGITRPDGSRTFKRLPPGTSEAKAGETAKSWNAKAAKDPTLEAPAPGGESFADWSTRWIQYRRDRGYAAVRDDESRLRTHLLPRLGPRQMAAITRRDLEELVQELDRKVQASEISWKTAVNVWAVVTRAFKDACRSKRLALRVRDDNPSADIEGPDRGADRSKTFVYPSEFSQFVACKQIPLAWRRLVALAVYLGVRAGELEVLEWDDFDLQHSKVNVHRAMDRDSNGDDTKSVKDKDPRPFGIEPELLPLLRAMHAEAKGRGRVVQMPRARDLAETLRDYLKLAGVTRAELFTSDATRINLRFHDLRASTVTWMAIRGDGAERIWQRVGHEDWATMRKYLRTAEALATGFGTVFPRLPAALLKAESGAGPARNDPQKIRGRPSTRNFSGADGTRIYGLPNPSENRQVSPEEGAPEPIRGAAKCAEPGGAIDRSVLDQAALWVSLRGWSAEHFEDLEGIRISAPGGAS